MASRRRQQNPDLPNPYEPFVREVLTRLSAELGSGQLSIRQEGGGARYVVEAPGHSGRNIVLPASREALKAPSTLPERSPKGLLSKLTLTNAIGDKINVPKSAIVRDHNHVTPAITYNGVCRGCEFGTCPHGWADPHPTAIVVLQLRNDNGFNSYGWYVRFTDHPTRLVRVPDAIIKRMSLELAADSHMRHSTLVTMYEDHVTAFDWDEDACFHATACTRFARYRTRVCAAVAKEKKRKRPLDDDRITRSSETCVICLEERPTARKRCRHDHCGTHVCDTCHSDSRGLCPVCDRSHINADYPCSSCHRLTRLSQYGFPCTSCNVHSLCSHCYTSFGSCGACESCD